MLVQRCKIIVSYVFVVNMRANIIYEAKTNAMPSHINMYCYMVYTSYNHYNYTYMAHNVFLKIIPNRSKNNARMVVKCSKLLCIWQQLYSETRPGP